MAWRKRKDINGVGVDSMVGLKALLFQKGQERKRYKSRGEKMPKTVEPIRDIMAKKNKGLEGRAARDRVEGEEDPLYVSAKRMKEKAKLYEKLLDGKGDNGENYLVDFEQKSWESSTVPELVTNPSKTQFSSADMTREEERRKWEEDTRKEMNGEDIEEKEKIKRLQLLDKLVEQTQEGRQRHEYLKAERKRRAEERREKIKQLKARRKGANISQQSTSVDKDKTTHNILAAVDNLIAEAKRSASGNLS